MWPFRKAVTVPRERDWVDDLCGLITTRPGEWVLQDSGDSEGYLHTSLTHSSGLEIRLWGSLEGMIKPAPRPFNRCESRRVRACVPSLRKAKDEANEAKIVSTVSAARIDYGQTARTLAQMVLDGRADIRPLLDALLDIVNG